MDESAHLIAKRVSRPDGSRLSFADLPLPDTKRWVVRRKAEVVAAVQGGLLSLDDACSRYTLDPGEFLSWQNCIACSGVAGLRVTRIQSRPKSRKRSGGRRPRDL